MNGIGLFGGTFDPIHQGHIALAKTALQQLKLAQVRLIPAGQPWQRKTIASAQHRLHMTELACLNHPGLWVDDREIRRQKTTYTIDTLLEFRSEWGTNIPLWLILGIDAFLSLPTWHRWIEILPLVNIAITGRPHYSKKTLMDSEPMQLLNKMKSPTTQKWAWITMPEQPISSTTLRQMFQENTSPNEHQLSPLVLHYIHTHQLYTPTL